MANVEMEIEEYSRSLSRSRSEGQKPSASWKKRTAVIVVWAALLGGAGTMAYLYNHDLQTKLETIQQTNQQNVEALNKTIAGLQDQLKKNDQNAQQLQKQFQNVEAQLASVREEMALAGDSLSSSDETKKALSQRITDLSAELQKLQSSIAKLEEAARVY